MYECVFSNLGEVDTDASGDFHSVSLAVLDRVGHSSGRDEGLGRHAADVEAIAAHKVVLYESHLPKHATSEKKSPNSSAVQRSAGQDLGWGSVGVGPSNCQQCNRMHPRR